MTPEQTPATAWAWGCSECGSMDRAVLKAGCSGREHRVYEPVTIEDRGIHVVDPPDYIGISLELLAEADPRALKVNGSIIYLGTARSVAYRVIGIDFEYGGCVLQCAKWSTVEALSAQQAHE